MDTIGLIEIDYEQHLDCFRRYNLSRKLTTTEYSIYMLLCDIWKRRSENILYPSQISFFREDIVDRIEISKSWISETIKRLIEIGLINNYGGANGHGKGIKLSIVPYPGGQPSDIEEILKKSSKGDKNTNIAQNINGANYQTINECEKELQALKKENEMLKKTIQDKDKIISLLEQKKR